MLSIAERFDHPGLLRYVASLRAWFDPELQRAYEAAILPDGRWRLFLGMLAYGSYVERFLEFCAPSLLAPGNLDALFEPTLVIHTDAAGAALLARSPRMAAIVRLARVEIHQVPAGVLEQVPIDPAHKYWLLGGAHNLHMQMAKYRAHAYHMLMPDHFYAAGYFANLARLAAAGHDAIVQGALSTRIEAIGPQLKARGCDVPADELVGLGLDHLHWHFHGLTMNGRGDFNTSLLLLMIGADAVHIACPHMSPVYLSHAVLMRAPIRLFNTIDGQLPFLIPADIAPYVPAPSDGMAYMELSRSDKAFFGAGCSLDQFCVRFWVVNYCQRGFERFFGLTTRLPLPPGYVPPVKPMTLAEIEDLLRIARSAVAASFKEIHAMLPDKLRTDPTLGWADEAMAAA